jgi:hypothetical protein
VLVFPDSYSATFAREACSASSPPPFDLALCTSATPVRFNFCVRARATCCTFRPACLSSEVVCLLVVLIEIFVAALPCAVLRCRFGFGSAGVRSELPDATSGSAQQEWRRRRERCGDAYAHTLSR